MVHELYEQGPAPVLSRSALFSRGWLVKGVTDQVAKTEILTGLSWKPVASWTRFFSVFIVTLETLRLTVTCFISSEGLTSLYSSCKVQRCCDTAERAPPDPHKLTTLLS